MSYLGQSHVIPAADTEIDKTGAENVLFRPLPGLHVSQRFKGFKVPEYARPGCLQHPGELSQRTGGALGNRLKEPECLLQTADLVHRLGHFCLAIGNNVLHTGTTLSRDDQLVKMPERIGEVGHSRELEAGADGAKHVWQQPNCGMPRRWALRDLGRIAKVAR